MRFPGALQAIALLTSILCAVPGWAQKDGPTITVNSFANYPERLLYFEDSDIILVHDRKDRNIYRSEDAGITWKTVDGVDDGEAYALRMHEFDKTQAFILTNGIRHYRTTDRGKTWNEFFTGVTMSLFRPDVLQFHADDPTRIIFNGMEFNGLFHEELALYTTDGFATDAQYLRGGTFGCWWAKSSHAFTTGNSLLDKNRILCVAGSPLAKFIKQDRRLLISDEFFQATSSDGIILEKEPLLDTDKTVQGIVNVAVVKKYLLAATTSFNTDEMALFVSDDSENWHRAVFPTNHRVMQEAYTVLESTNYSIQIDVMTTRPSNPMGVMFTSNSNGTYFTENVQYTNRNERGHVDFEKITGIQGIFLVNKVDNHDEVAKAINVDKRVVTGITFDDGRTFQAVTSDGKRAHLHSVTELSNIGRVYSSPAPGLVMAIGNTGDYLGDYWKDGKLFVSDDAGVTWTKALDGPHKYEFGDSGSILVAVRDSRDNDVDEIQYSLDHGMKWTSKKLPDGLRIRPIFLTTTQDSTSLKFIVAGEVDGVDKPFRVIAIDFEGLHEATCTQSDMVDWWARVDDKKQPTCLMGHTQKFQRRKKDAACFLKQQFKEPLASQTDCDCTDADYECDFNFVQDDDGNCKPQVPVAAPDGVCKPDKPDVTFKGPSGWRKIPGNTCKSKSGEPKEREKEYKCSESWSLPSAPATDKIAHTLTRWEGDWNGFEKHYLERGVSSSTDDETILLRPILTTLGQVSRSGSIAITQDHGKKWESIPDLQNEKIWAIIPHTYFKDMVFFPTTSETVWYTVDRGRTFHNFKAPYLPDAQSSKMPLYFHPDKKDWLLWVGKKCDAGGLGDPHCHWAVSWSKDRGDDWETGARYVDRCEFIGSSTYKYAQRKEEEILCLQRQREDNSNNNPWQLVSTGNWFEDKAVRLENVKDFATMSEFIVVATEHSDKRTLEALASLNGESYAPAHFPAFFEVPHQHSYTVLDSSTHAVNLFVATNIKSDRQMGSILKSNSNGTSYVLSISGVNCDRDYYVDFEKMLGLQGVALVNVVANADEASAPKKLRTMITHNDGAQWNFLPPPATDSSGNAFFCKSATGDENCALHIHGYTARQDHRKTYSSEGAVGYMFGWGNVGATLGTAEDADTFMTNDAGISWRHVRKGRYSWSLGDQGSVIVLVKTRQYTDEIVYSVDGGKTWPAPYKFSDEKVWITDVTTLRSGGSRNFLLWGTDGRGVLTVNLDFSAFSERVCKHDKDSPAKSDYDLWSPRHPAQENDCLFGHISQYLRKKSDMKCYNDFKLETLYSQQNCSCTRQDYECDYNYELDNHGACHLVQGLAPLTAKEWCGQHPDAIEYYPPSGYRRLPLTTCVGGTEYDKVLPPQPCTGKEDEFERKHAGPSAAVILFAVILPIAAATAIGWWVWRNWARNFGQIRLGEQNDMAEESPWVRYPVMALAAVIALVAALPMVASSLWRSAQAVAERWGWSDSGRGAWSRLGGGAPRRFTTRDSFARGRDDYPVVDEDEGELLGEDSDSEV